MLETDKNLVNVVLASNKEFFIGLLVTIASVLHSEKNGSINIHVIDGGITDEQWDSLSGHVSKYKSLSKLQRHKLDDEILDGITAHGEFTKLTYARVLIPHLLDSDYAVYIDSDFVVSKQISDLLFYRNTDAIVMGVMEPNRTLLMDLPWMKNLGITTPYINAGILFINLKKWREFNSTVKLMDFLRKESYRLPMVDQAAINYILQGRIGVLPNEWNLFANQIDIGGFQLSPGKVNIHFNSGFKPWKRPLPYLSHKIWWMYFDEYLSGHKIINPFLDIKNVLRYSSRIKPSNIFKIRDSLARWKGHWRSLLY